MSVFRAGSVCVSLGLALLASGCGGGTSTITGATRAPAATQARTAAKPAGTPTPRLSILSPRAGARTASTLTVRIALSGTPPGGAPRFRYVLDRHLERSGSTRLTFHGLASGLHRLEVLSAATSTVRASTTFTVRAPRPVAVVVPAETPRPTPVPTQPLHTTNTTPLPRTPLPPTKTTAPAPPKANPPPASGGIPQGPNAGDGDGDNNGGPSDGDGNL
jgi:hypothetical protein